MPKPLKVRPLTQEWKNALRGNFLDRDCRYKLADEDIEHALNEQETMHDTLTKYRIGPYLIMPTMSDDSESSVRVLAAVGFTLAKIIKVEVGNCDCETIVFVEDPAYTGKRGVLLACDHYDLAWNVFLS